MPQFPNLPGPGPLVTFHEVPETAVVSLAVEVTIATHDAGGWYVSQLDMDTPEDDGFWNGQVNESPTTLDSFPAVFVGPPASDDVQATQTYRDDYPHDDDPEDPWHANVYGFPDQSMDVVAALFPPIPDETYAAQPHYGDDYATYLPVETEDYAAPPEQVEFLAPPEVVIPELLAAQPHFGEWVWDAEATEDYQSESTLDVTPAFFPPVVTDTDEVLQAAAQLLDTPWFADPESEDVGHLADQNEWTAPPEAVIPELFAAQPLAEQPWFAEQETEDTHQPPEQLEAFAPPEAVDPELGAAQPHPEGPWIDPDATEDYGPPPEQNEWLAPPEVSLAELTAAQPFPDHDFATLVPDETTDYAAMPEQLEAFAPPEAVAPELLASQPLAEQPWFDSETEDYAADSTIDASPLTFPAQANTDEEFQAASQLPEHDAATLTPEETTDYAAMPEQNEWLAPPEVIVPELIASQPHYGELSIPQDETDDYANDTALEPPWSIVPPEVPLAELLAAQPLSEPFWAIPDETEDYANESTLDVAALTPATPQEPDETFAAQPFFGDLPIEPDETQDYANDTALDIAAIPLAEPIETFAAQPHFGEFAFPEGETEDYQPDIDALPAALAPTPDETHAAQPLPHDLIETLTPDEQTVEDWGQVSSLDVTPQFSPPLAVEVIAAQPHYGQLPIEADALTIEDGHVTALEVPALIPAPTNLGEVLPITKRGRYSLTMVRFGVAASITKRATYDPTLDLRVAHTPTITKRGQYRPLLA